MLVKIWKFMRLFKFCLDIIIMKSINGIIIVEKEKSLVKRFSFIKEKCISVCVSQLLFSKQAASLRAGSLLGHMHEQCEERICKRSDPGGRSLVWKCQESEPATISENIAFLLCRSKVKYHWPKVQKVRKLSIHYLWWGATTKDPHGVSNFPRVLIRVMSTVQQHQLSVFFWSCLVKFQSVYCWIKTNSPFCRLDMINVCDKCVSVPLLNEEWLSICGLWMSMATSSWLSVLGTWSLLLSSRSWMVLCFSWFLPSTTRTLLS